MDKPTPMMQQYLEVKEQYPDALLLYRMGDFYELFMEDALAASKILEIALTSRDKQAENPIPMCGVPYHAAEGYIAKLVAAGIKVAVCDQMEDPRKAKGLVRREVTRVITPGLILDTQNLTAKQPNYLAAVSHSPRTNAFGLAYLDISTADFRVVELESQDVLLEELLRVSPKEILIPEDGEDPWVAQMQNIRPFTLTPLPWDSFDRKRSEERLLELFHTHSLAGYGVDGMDHGIRAAGAILAYMQANLLGSCSHIKRLLPYSRSEYMTIDDATVRNLDIFLSSSFQGRRGSLLDILDRTGTAMGGRRLRHWLRYPLLDLERILSRQEAVAELAADASLRSEIIEGLGTVGDIERLNGRNCAGASNPRDLVALKKSLQALPGLRVSLSPCTSRVLSELCGSWDDLADVTADIEAVLVDPAPLNTSSGGIIREGVHPDLDRYIHLSRDARSWMADYETRERQNTGISSLKVRYNKVFGYYIEVSKSNLGSVPPEYFRKQTLVNAERFITEELKTFETQVLEADEKRLELEQQIFAGLQRTVAAESSRIQAMAEKIADLDCFAALAETASRNDYCRPEMDAGDSLHISSGRHPVIEHFLKDGGFVPNDLDMDMESQQVLVITGPNMAGKSTILRQAALIVLMAQIGSFVPASEARIGVVDRIFTRVGASDDLARGRSTFMVEMQETANILHQATARSLIVLDEIGRGTSTFDGLSIAWAVAEFLHDFKGVGIKTLFATHYHELTELSRTRERVKNFNVAIKEWQNDIIFFHKLVPGGTNRSYGIQVAQLAGLPERVTDRAREILSQLESGSSTPAIRPEPASRRSRTIRDRDAGVQLTLFRPSLEWLRDQILALDLDRITPLAALQTFYALKEKFNGTDRQSPGAAEGLATISEKKRNP
ncbi:MAG: DNA mismatch repair protein MutS [Syntrophobacteraceae bacterium]|nr:DNA mismatch repair protein MutS [Desulfobacteraceae bacterium]